MKFIFNKRIPIKKSLNEINKKIPTIVNDLKNKYSTDYASLYLPYDKNSLRKIKELITEKKRLNPKLIIVIGIGGSNLGTVAIYESLKGIYYNEVKFLDTVDSDKTKFVLKEAEKILRYNKNILVNIVSKSGSTTETIALAEVFISLLKKYKKNYQKNVVVTTNTGSKLDILAQQNNFSVLHIPELVGGRFSVFSPVGLFPLGLLGINLNKLLIGSKKAIRQNLKKNSMAVKSACLINYWNNNKKIIHDTFLFDTSLESLGKWYRQLMAESLGKEKNLQGKIVNKGITPTVSIGSVDLHSMAQLYLGGPKNKFTTFVTVNPKNQVRIPNWKSYDMLVNNIQNKTFENLMQAIFKGVKKAYIKQGLPFSEIVLEKKSEEEIAYFLQFKMLEVMFLAILLNINAFNQPAVESYKEETRKLLKK